MNQSDLSGRLTRGAIKLKNILHFGTNSGLHSYLIFK